MRLYRWAYRRLHVPMIEDDDRKPKLWCTSGILCSALAIRDEALRWVYHANRDKFSGNCVSQANAIEFLRANRVEFGLNYVRGDMRLWSVRDMVKVAFMSRSRVAAEFADSVIDLIEEYATRMPISVKQYTAMVRENEALAAEVGELRSMIVGARPALAESGSAAGAALAAHRALKILKGQ